jgi:hypothetical protein
MAISRSLMNRQLRANGGIMDVTPRENFGLGSSLKKFVRKIIPNEVAEIATKAAPFVAPFNPLLAAGMSGIGTFDQTGSIGDSLKAGGMNYALGQGARYIGGGAQNLQTGFNPFSGYDASAGLTRGLLTNPVSDQGGLGKFFSNQGTQGVQGVGAEPQSIEGFLSQDAAKNVGLESERLAELASQTQNQFIKNSPSAMDSFKSIISFDTSAAEKGNAALDLLKRGGQAAFTKPNPIPGGKPLIDKAAVMGAIAFAGSYAEALALADDAGVELTEGAYDEARKTEKQEEYAGYLTNFFGGKKDGGRIGFKDGANKSIEEKIAELEFLTNKLMTEEGIQDRGYASKLASDIIGMKNESIDPNRLKFLNNESALSALPRDIRPEDEYYDTLKALENRADGGRIGLKDGTDFENYLKGKKEFQKQQNLENEYREYLEDMRRQKIAEQRNMAAYGGRIGYGNGANEFMSEQMMLESNPGAAESGSPITIDTTMTGLINKYNTYKKSAPGVSEETRIFLKNDLLKSLEDAGISQEEFMMRLSEDTEMKANGGRIGYALGTPRDTTMFEELNADTIYQPENTIPLPNEMPGGDNRMPGDDRRVDKYDDYEFDQDKKTDSIRLLADFYMREEGMSESDAYEKAVGEIYDIQLKEGGRVNRKLGSPEEGERSGVMEMLAVDVDAGGDEEENMMMAYKPGSFYKKDFKPMEVDAINERLQSFLDGEGGGLPLPLINTVKGIANTLKAGKTVFTGPEKTTIIRNLAGRSRGTSAYKELGKSIPEAKRIMDNPINYLKDAAIFKELLKGIFKKDGGRIGLRDGTGGNRVSQLLILRDEALSKGEDTSIFDAEIFQLTGKTFKSIGGISEIPTGQPRLNQGGVAERDYRETGGFVPVGIKERADDVPAMLSKNEFVMTADSVRGLGNGSVEEGSKKLYNTMKQAEQKGKIA